jgi:Ras-related protein Rab-8A
MLDEKVVSTEEGEKLAKEFGIQFYECSAKNDINVDDAFIGIARSVKDRLVADGAGGPAKPTGGVQISNKQGPAAGKKPNCC